MAKKVIFDEAQVQKGTKQGASMYPTPAQSVTDGFARDKIRDIIPSSEREKMEKEAQKEAYKKHLEKIAEENLHDPQEEATKQAKSDVLKEEKNNERKLDELVRKSQNVLLVAKSTFPFDLFPDTITIDTNKVNVVNKSFFGSGRIHSIFIKDVVDVFVEASPFFATLKIVDRGFIENLVVVSYLKKNEAHKARRLIQGLVVAIKDNIELAGIEGNDFAEKIEELGRATEAKL